ncbi:hypothetical protein BDR26DRAFT_971348 [Obelidium mucronatum]|nr:hypothetical protein BDR26DRAFT_971348 [Obelidium mucronatum]
MMDVASLVVETVITVCRYPEGMTERYPGLFTKQILAVYVQEHTRKVSNNKYHFVFAPIPADTNATKIAKKATARAARQQAANEKTGLEEQSKISFPLLGSDDPIGLGSPSKQAGSSSNSTIPAHASPSSAKANPTPASSGSAKTTPGAGKTASGPPSVSLTSSASKATTDPKATTDSKATTVPNTATNTTPASPSGSPKKATFGSKATTVPMATSASKVSKAMPAPKATPAPKTADKTADSSSKPVPKTAVLKPRSAGASKTATFTVISPAVADSMDNLKAMLKTLAEAHRNELTPLDNAPEGSEADEDDEIGDVDFGENELDAEKEEEEGPAMREYVTFMTDYFSKKCHRCDGCHQFYNGKEISGSVMDGKVMGHLLCSVPGCVLPILGVNTLFCSSHAQLKNECIISGCKRKKTDTVLSTCGLSSHNATVQEIIGKQWNKDFKATRKSKKTRTSTVHIDILAVAGYFGKAKSAISTWIIQSHSHAVQADIAQYGLDEDE